MTKRAPLTLIAIAGALVATLAAQVDGSSFLGLGLAILAGLGLSLMLRGTALRVLAVVLTVLSIASAGWAFAVVAWLVGAGFVLSALGAAAIIWFGPTWLARSPEAARKLDDWAAMDSGVDPTDAEDEQEPTHPAG